MICKRSERVKLARLALSVECIGMIETEVTWSKSKKIERSRGGATAPLKKNMCPNYGDCLTCDNFMNCPYDRIPTPPICDEFVCVAEMCKRVECISYEEEFELYRGEML